MTTRAYNKVSRTWASTITGLELTPSDDWIINPQFVNEQDAMTMGQEFWTFQGDTIMTPTRAEYDAVMLARARDRKWREIQAERDRRVAGGVFVAGKWFHSDQSSRIQQLGMVIMGANLPPINWKTMDNTFITMTPAIAMGIFQTTAMKDSQIFTVAEMRRAAMLTLPDPGEYEHMAGNPTWPPIFGE